MKRKVISMVLAMAVMLTNISAATDVYASEPQKVSVAEDLSGRELEEREEGKSTKEDSECREGLQEEQQTTDEIQGKPESAGEMQEKTESTGEIQEKTESAGEMQEKTESAGEMQEGLGLAEEGIEAYAAAPAFENAQALTLGQEYSGSITNEADKQYYKFAIDSSGSVNLTATAGVQNIYYAVYDAEGNNVWKKSYYWESTTKTSNVSEKLELTKGEYYFAVEKASSYTGTYKIQLSFESAGESCEETGNGTNNTMETASLAELNKECKGQIALNDDQDYHKFTLAESGKIHMTVNAHMKRSATYKIMDAKGKEQWTETPSVNNAGVANISKDLDLSGGAYYLVVTRGGTGIEYTGNYTFKLDFTSADESYKETQDNRNDTFETASEVSLDELHKGQIALNEDKDYYKFTMEASGSINLSATANVQEIYYAVYDSEGNELWKKSYQWDSTSQTGNVTEKFDLTKGEYYFAVEKYSSYGKSYTGNYSFQLSFQSAEESHEETGNGTNNTMATASEAELNKECKGLIALNDDQDWYKFTLAESGRVHLAISARMRRSAAYKITDKKGTELWQETPSVNNVGASSISKDLDLTGGTYYLIVTRRGTGADYTGNYTFTLSFASAGESHGETQESRNDTFETASEVTAGEQYKGQIALNDEKDYYKFTLEASGSINLAVTANVQEIYYSIYDSGKTELWKKSYQWDSTSQASTMEEKFDLTKGEYYFVVERYKSYGNVYTGNYSFQLPFTSAEESYEETGNGTNNTMGSASQIELETQYKGQIAYNDDVDFYAFTVPESGRLQIKANANIPSIVYKIYNSQAEEVWSIPSYADGTDDASSITENADLTGGSYYFVAKKGDGTGNYSFNLHLHIYHEEITKATATADGKIEQKCECGDIFSTTIIYYPERNDLSEILYTFDGLEKMPTVTVIGSDGEIISDSNYTVTYADGRVAAGTYDVIIEFKGNYSGTVTKTFGIERRPINDAAVILSNAEVIYNGSAQEPEIKEVQVQLKSGLTFLKNKVDYEVSYRNNVNVGTAEAVITGIGNYTGTVTKTFQIKSCPVSGADITLAATVCNYNGKPWQPAVTSVQVQLAAGRAVLKNGVDYAVSYRNNTNIGKAEAVITGMGNYAGTASKVFEIDVKKGSIFTVNAYKYKILDSSKVSFVGLANANTAKVSIPKSVTIGGKSFKITELGNKALRKKTKVTSVTIASGIETIGTSAFEGCTKLKKVTVGGSVKKIGAGAFKNCKKLGNITIKSKNLKTVGKNAFKGIKATAKIKVPAKKLKAYKKLLKNKGQGKKVKIVK